MSGVNDGGNPRPPYSPPISNGAAQNHGPSPTVTVPTALTTASAATRTPLWCCADAEPMPALEIRGGGAETGADAAEREIRSRRRLPPRSRDRGRARKRPQALLPPFSRSKQIAPGTIGMIAPRTSKPRPCSASQACTPPPASSPKAEPPDSAMASIGLHGVGDDRAARLRGCRGRRRGHRSPPPTGASKITAVTPDASAALSAWPTRTPAISVRRFFIACHLEAQMTAWRCWGQRCM